ncbi:putative PurR-regulated permease PerM [Pseudonocardia sediminis]|uniref:Putative PurR-regulated permease PerM n=1 Tax=Pseudonocardia sediminis TaxID=1397368 RepID=A0A4Q7US91_PSEST|nr:AI-2E family transporter [Pseudonocardia sediminis]RZT83678.1 putative PurR-regulated permease PerM [Pseudonocardia sediminis]
MSDTPNTGPGLPPGALAGPAGALPAAQAGAFPTTAPDGTHARQIPPALALATGLAWRGLLLAAAVAVLLWVVAQLSLLVIPVVIALILAALLSPAARLVGRVPYMPHAVATGIVVIGGLAVFGGILWLVVAAFLNGLPDLSTQLGQSFVALQNWLSNGPLHVDNQQLNAVTSSALSTLQRNQAELATNVLGAVGTVGEIATETLLTLFVLAFFIHDGGRIWRWILSAVPRAARTRTDIAGRRAFASLVGYTRAIVVVAAVDAITAGVGLWLIGVPLAVPLATLIFFGAFIPTLGAVVTGIVAVLIALVTGGWVDALLVAGLLLLVQNIEGYVLQPLLLGRSVKLHPLAVVLPIAGGLILAGIPGALLAVPLVTLADASVRSINRASDKWLADPSTIDPLDPRSARPDNHPEISGAT